MGARTWLGLLVVAAAGAAFYGLLRGEPGSAQASAEGSASCRDCHGEVWREWEESWHSRAWSDPDVRALSRDFANEECIACHAPRPVLATGLENRVEARGTLRDEGVGCLACHALGEGAGARVAGTIDRPDAPCAPERRAELSSTAFCATCHDQHQTVAEWLVTRYAAEKIGCIDCHMPFRGGDPARGRDHRMHGGHSLELLQAAVDLRAWREGARVHIEVENVGAGHNFPTDERSRAADVFWRPRRAEPVAWRFLYRFRSPYRDEVGVEETVLAAHATRAIALEHPEAAEALEVALFYKLTPYWADPERPDPEREARLVERVELAP